MEHIKTIILRDLGKKIYKKLQQNEYTEEDIKWLNWAIDMVFELEYGKNIIRKARV